MKAGAAASLMPRERRAEVPGRLLRGLIIWGPAIVLILCSASADLVAVVGGDPLGIWQVLPAGPVAGDWLSAELSSVAFLLIGIALLRRKRAGFWLGLAVAGGISKKDDDGKTIPIEVREGDRVLITRYGGTEVKLDGKEYKILNSGDLLAIVE